MQISSFNEETLSEDIKSSFGSDYLIKSIIGHGSFGTVYKIKSSKNLDYYAAKVSVVDKINEKKNTLSKEHAVLQNLQNELGFPSIKDFLIKNDHEIMIMKLLGSSLQSKFEECGKHFSLKTILMIGFQAIERLESLHKHGFIHRDIKPDNFVIGFDENGKKIIHLIDFGLSSSYLDKNNKHIWFKKYAHTVGTPYFLSVYAHLGIQATRRDDLIGLGYMLVHLFKGQLPWINVKGTMNEKMVAMCRQKATVSLKKFCENLPEEFISYFNHVFALRYLENPDYTLLKGLFIKMLDSNGLKNDGFFDWIPAPVCKEGIDLKARKITGKSPSLYMKKNIED